MGALIGLLFALGALLMWRSGSRAPRRVRRARSAKQRLSDLLSEAGYVGVRPDQLCALCAVLAVIVFIIIGGISRSASIAVAFATFAGYAPIGFLRRRRRSRTTELRELWPDVVDNLASAVRAGLSLAEAIGQVGIRGPEPLRPAFGGFAEDYRATGRFADCLDRLKAALADPTADRIIEAMRLAREVGGSDLGRLMRTLSQFLRQDARTRAELETRQGWTIGAAKLAVAAPWIVLGLLSLRPETVVAYDSAVGATVLAGGGAASLTAYRTMLRIAALPTEQRVLR